jgi:hypothetical protein
LIMNGAETLGLAGGFEALHDLIYAPCAEWPTVS